MRTLLAVAVLASTALSQAATRRDLRGVVLGPHSAPVPNARVTARTEDHRVVGTARSDGSGEFLLKGLPSETVLLSVSAKHSWAPRVIDSPTTTNEPTAALELRAFDGAEVTGVVRDTDGKPVAGAEVVVVSDVICSALAASSTDVAITDRAGRFELPAPLGSVHVRVSAAGFEFAESQLQVDDDSSTVVSLVPGQGRTWVFTVTGVPSDRVADVRCSLAVRRGGLLGNTALLPPRLLSGLLDAGGRCEIRGLPNDGEVWYSAVSANGLRFDPSDTNADASAFHCHGAISDADAAPSEPTLRGTVLDRAGEPVVGLRGQLFGTHSRIERSFVTDADGTFACDGAYVEGEALLIVCSERQWTLVLRTDDARMLGDDFVSVPYQRGKVVEFSVEPKTELRGVLKDAKGKPIAFHTVRAEYESPSLPGVRLAAGRSATDADGKFVIDGLTTTRADLHVMARSWRGQASAGPFRQPEGGVVDDVELILAPPYEVTGSVVDAKGKAIPGVIVDLFEWTDVLGHKSAKHSVTLADRDGKFSFRGVYTGRFGLRASTDGHNPFAVDGPFDVDGQGVHDRQLPRR